MTIIFREKKEYCYDADLYILSNSEELRLKWRRLLNIIMIFIIVAYFFEEVFRETNYNEQKLINILFSVLILLFIFVFVRVFSILENKIFQIIESLYRKIWLKLNEENYIRYIDLEVKIVLGDTGIIWSRGEKKLHITYENIRLAKDSGKYIYIFVSMKNVIWIPNCIFRTEEEKKQVITFINYKINKSNKGAERISEISI